MKEYKISRSTRSQTIFSPTSVTRDIVFMGNDDMTVSDGYHTMDELYDHRIDLYIALCKALNHDGKFSEPEIWRSKLHADGSNYEGWFILGIGKKPGEQISYHLPITRWIDTGFAELLDNAPEFDGHTPTDVLERLRSL